MAGKILLIGEAASLTTAALAAAVEEKGVRAVRTAADAGTIEQEAKDADVLLVFAGDLFGNSPDAAQRLKEICLGGGCLLFVVGYREELSVFETVIPKTLIEREVIRPVENADKLASELCAAAAASARHKGQKHILLVDDDVVFLQMMKSWISSDYRVSVVRSGQQALAFLKAHQPDLILLDYDMPGMSGPQVLEKLWEEHSDVPVFFLTGKCDERSAASAARLEPSGYLLKAAGKEHVLDAVRQFFAEHP